MFAVDLAELKVLFPPPPPRKLRSKAEPLTSGPAAERERVCGGSPAGLGPGEADRAPRPPSSHR